MVKIKLTRQGVKKKPFYRIVAIDERKKMGGQPLEILGYWNPSKDEMKLDKKKLNKWIANGAQLSTGTRKLLEAKS